MADQQLSVDPPKPVWRRFQPGSWEATWLHGWEQRPDGWWGVVDLVEPGRAQGRSVVPADRLRPRDPADGRRLLSRISGEPPGP